MAKISCIVTVLNEEKTIGDLLNSLLNQTRVPDEIIIVDGGSTDATATVVQSAESKRDAGSAKFKVQNCPVRLYSKKGNRAVGRNFAIEKATHEIIVCTDAGCVPKKDWVEKIIKPFKKSVDVVAGYYEGLTKTVFQKCVVPYVLVMPNRINPKEFLPATRSMAFTKSIWKKAGGFPEEFSYNEDYVFAHKLKKIGARMEFKRNAIVSWIPPTNLWSCIKMFFKFSYGDTQAGIVRPKVLVLFARAIVFGLMTFFSWHVGLILLAGYIAYAIGKNYRYVKRPEAFYILPALQLGSDIAIIAGSLSAWLKI